MIVFAGRGKSGSWAIRGDQLGTAVGGAVRPGHTPDVAGARLVVLVKRPSRALLEHLHRAAVPIVWDIVDAWPQPLGEEWDRAQSMDWLRAQVALIRPRALVAATRAMAADCAEFGLPVLTLPHHARPGIQANPVRPVARAVGYEGDPRYLGPWEGRLHRACARRGWRFVLNPPNLADMDIAVAFRAQGGYAATQWKSNVKLANAQGSGTPCVLGPAAGYLETACGAERWASAEDELEAAFADLVGHRDRSIASRALRAAAPSIEQVSKEYRTWLDELSKS